MFDNIIFYNNFGAGDLFESREFVKEIITSVEAKEYFYSHNKNPRMFIDIPNIKYIPINIHTNAMIDSAVVGNDLYINTWIGRNSKYVLPNIGCSVDMNHKMFNDILTKRGLPVLSKPFKEYIPDPDFTKFNTKMVDDFVLETSGKRRVLICNGDVMSLQAMNFDFTPVIDRLAEKYPDTVFIETRGIIPTRDNIVSSDSIIKPDDGFSLNEISYLALFCDVIVGRKSGPAVFAHSKGVWNDGSKKSLSFTYGKDASHFVRQNDIFPLKKYWSPKTNSNEVFQEIERLLG